jgi:hypothetical protein
MLTLTAQVMNVFQTPKGTDRETGQEYGGEYKVQLLRHRTLRNGEKVMETLDLTVDNPDQYRGLVGKKASIEVEEFAMNAGKRVPVRFRHISGPKENGSSERAKV